MEPNKLKKQHIIEVALRRFSHFGINKTTMSEIAEDISVSKANLYYYFPDKAALVLEVLRHLIEEANTSFKQLLDSTVNIMEMLVGFIEIKKNFFEKHYLLHVTMGHADSNLNIEEINALGQYAEKKELEVLSKAFATAIVTKQLVTFDVTKTSHIYLTILKGIAMVAISKTSNKDIPEIALFSEIFDKQRVASAIFVNGLRHEIQIN